MTKLYSFFIVFLILIACKEKNNLVEVQLPEPEETVSTVFGNPKDVKAKTGPFQLVSLKYAYDALQPAIKGQTMELHYAKHYLGYTNAVNKAIATNKEWEGKSIDEILSKVTDDEAILKNNAGGYYNHSLFFEILTPKGAKKPNEKLLDAINTSFGSFSLFKNKFIAEANNHFGPGWAWLLLTKSGELKIVTTNQQDNTVMNTATVKGIPVLGIDLWEHAYYLDYQNNRKEYIQAVFELINWTVVSKKYEEAQEKMTTIAISKPIVKSQTSVKPVLVEESKQPSESKEVKE